MVKLLKNYACKKNYAFSWQGVYARTLFVYATACWLWLWWCQMLANSSAAAAARSSVTVDKCFIVWNGTTDNDDDGDGSAASNDTSTRRLACPYGWDYDRDPIETSIVTDVSITRQKEKFNHRRCTDLHCSQLEFYSGTFLGKTPPPNFGNSSKNFWPGL